MKLRKRQTRKDQALDAVASVTKTWSEWQLAKRAGKGVAKAKEVRPSKIKGFLNSKKVKLAGAVAVAGGTGAFVARKLKGGDPAESYSGPAPSEAVEAAASAPEAETPPPLTMAPDPATKPAADKEPAVPDSALRYRSTMPAAADVPADTPPPEPDFGASLRADAEPPDADAAPDPVAELDTSEDDASAGNGDEPAAGRTALRGNADDE
jgi:hypothetical protein